MVRCCIGISILLVIYIIFDFFVSFFNNSIYNINLMIEIFVSRLYGV